MRREIIYFWTNTDGSAAIEYSVLAGALALALIAAIVSLTETLNALYQTIITGMASIGGAAG
jgi:Flp pilus assembly pilin Flp